MENLSFTELEARLILHSLPKIGSKRFLQLISYFGSAKQALDAQSHWPAAGLPRNCQTIELTAIKENINKTLTWLERTGQDLIFWDSKQYPALLKEISDYPPVLFIKGNATILEMPQLAIVGSRNASRPGLDTTFQFAKSLATAGFAITSGLALGIDGAAHAGALAGAGTTIAVLGCGLQHLYPASHSKLANDIINNGGALISEFPLTTSPQASNFPRRNRIISGLALGTLVVEASLSSGSLITAKLAAEQGREVFAIPGSIHYPGVKGCHQLIRDGAILVENVGHILEALQGWKNISTLSMQQDGQVAIKEEAMESLLLTTLQAAPQASEKLAVSLALAYEDVLIELTELELMGKVTCEAGIWYAC